VRENRGRSESGRPSSAAQAVNNYRRDNPISEDPLVQSYLIESEASTGTKFAALHEPDLVIGGRNVIAGYGDFSVNSSIGAQNRFARDAIYRAVLNAPEDSYIRFILSLGDQ